MLFLAHTCLLVDERERERDSLIHSKRVVCGFSLSLSRAREEEEDQATDRRGPRRTPPDGCVVVVVVVLSTDRPKGKEKERKRASLEGYVVLARKSCRIQKEYQKGLHRIVSSLFFPPSTKKKTTRVIYSPRTSLFFSRTPEKTKKTKTCRSLSLSLSFRLSKHFRQKRRSFKPFVVDRKSLCRRPTKKTKKARDIFFKKKNI